MSSKMNKRKNRLSIKTGSESPITPNSRRSMLFDNKSTPTTPEVNEEDSCRTPVNARKRSCFREESPSQEFDLNSTYFLPESQDNHNYGAGVTWSWGPDSPVKMEKKKIPWVKPKPRIVQKISPVSSKPKVLRGFDKFQQELKLLVDRGVFIKCNDKENTIEPSASVVDAELDQSYNKNVSSNFLDFNISNDSDDNTDVTQYATISDKVCTNLNKSFENLLSKTDPSPNATQMRKYKSVNNFDIPNEFLNDSSFDMVLVDASQKAEENFDIKISPPLQQPAETTIEFNHSIENNDKKLSTSFLEDSLDEFLSLVPIDEIVKECRPSSSKKLFSNDNYSSVAVKTDKKTSYARHNSMPASPNTFKFNKIGKNNTKPLLPRHISMPTSDTVIEENISTSLESVSSVTSTNSVSIKKCTKAEIEQKRLAAMARLQATKRKLIASQTSRTSNVVKR